MECVCIYLVNFFLYVIIVPYLIYEKYLRINHSKSFIKKHSKGTLIISRILFINFKHELPQIIYILNIVYYLFWLLCGTCIVLSLLLKIDVMITYITIGLIIHSIFLVFLILLQHFKSNIR